jgi:SPP1 gp7 family putative phage head morphogenesis protein
MATSFAEAVHDSTIRRQVGIERFKSGALRRIISLLNEVDADIIDRLDSINGVRSRRRVEAVLREIRRINARAFQEILRRMGEEIEDFAEADAAFVTRSLNAALPDGVGGAVNFLAPSEKLLFVAAENDFNNHLVRGRTIRSWLDGIRSGDSERIESAVRLGFTEGQSVDDIIRRFRGARQLRFRDGIREVTRRQLESLIRTSVQSASSQARDAVYEENNQLLKGVQWVATLDGRTTKICMSLDQKVFPVDSGPRPPAHFNCRSTTVPQIKSWRELGLNLSEPPAAMRPFVRSTRRWRDIPRGERSLIDRGTVPGDLRYPQWLRRQHRDFVEDVMGVDKAKLFLDGDLAIDRFVDQGALREYSLEELRRREPQAFEKAGLSDDE